MMKESDATLNGVSLGDVLRILWRNKLWIAMIAVAVFLVGLIYTFAIAREKYASNATFVVAIGENEPSSEGYDLTNSLRLIETVASMLKEDIVLGNVAQEFGLAEEELSEMVGVTYSSASFLISVRVESDNATLSKELADAVVGRLIYVADHLQGFEFLSGALTQTSYAKNGVYSAPNKPLYLAISLVAGVVLGCGAALVKELCSTRFRTRKDVESVLGERVVGYFLDDKKRARKKGQEVRPDPVLLPTDIRSMEPYNKLLTNLRYADLEHPYRVVMVTSSHESELKSTVLSNLALCMRHNGKRVLVIDLDLRKPVLHKVFGLTREPGLVGYVEGKSDARRAVRRSECGVDVITAGRKILNPLVVIEHSALVRLISELRTEYDYILLDVPPVLACSDACAAAKLCDGVLFNVAMNDVKKREAVQALSALGMVGARIAGLNVTKAAPQGGELSYGRYYDYGESGEADRAAAFCDGEAAE